MKLRTPTYADVAATVALALALTTGGAYAAGKITGKDIAKNAITSPKIKNGTIQPVDLSSAAKSTMTGATGATGPRGFSAWDTIPSGTTVTGRIYDTGYAPSAGSDVVFNVNLPGVAPTALDNAHVNFAPDSSAATTDDDAACTGTYSAPTAPAGRVCVYPQSFSIANLTSVAGYTWADPAQRKYTFFVDSAAAAAGNWYFWVSWAYTAP